MTWMCNQLAVLSAASSEERNIVFKPMHCSHRASLLICMIFKIYFHPVHHHLLCKKKSCSVGLHIIYIHLKKATTAGNTVTKQKKPVIIFTPSISGMWGTHPVFHFYPHSALSSSCCSYFYLLLSCTECTTAGWCKTGRVTWDNCAFHCCLLAAQTDSITAGHLCHLIVAFVQLTAQTAHLWLQYVFQQLSEVKDMTGTCPQ